MGTYDLDESVAIGDLLPPLLDDANAAVNDLDRRIINGQAHLYGAGVVEVADSGSLPTASSHTGEWYVAADTGLYYVSDGSSWKQVGLTRWDNTLGLRQFAWDNANNREQMVFGDTGTWNVSGVTAICPTSVTTGGTLTGVAGYLRRIGNLVTFTTTATIQNSLTAGSNNIDYGTIPAGFRPVAATDSYSPVFGQGDGAFKGRWNVNNSTGVWGGRITNGAAGAVVCAFRYATNDAWPSSLSGSLVGSIPAA